MQWRKAVSDGEKYALIPTLSGMWNQITASAVSKGILSSPPPVLGSKKSAFKASKRKENEDLSSVSSKNARIAQSATQHNLNIDFTSPNPFNNLMDYSDITDNSSLKQTNDINNDHNEIKTSNSQTPKIKTPRVEPITIKKTEFYTEVINDIEVNILKNRLGKF